MENTKFNSRIERAWAELSSACVSRDLDKATKYYFYLRKLIKLKVESISFFDVPKN